ncbi:MAG: ABC exporter membrane fusion protein [Xenococcaceae cyanobacterium]
MTIQVFSKHVRLWTIVLVVAATTVTGTTVVKYSKDFWVLKPNASSDVLASAQPVSRVTALGRLVPQGEVINLSASPSVEGARLAQLQVQEGDEVKEGQIIAILDNRDRLQAALNQAQEQVKVAQAQLAQVKAGASVREIEAQRAVITRLEVELQETQATFDATIARLKAQLRNAQNDYQRYSYLYQEGGIAASERDRRQLDVETAQSQLNEASANRSRTIGALREQIKEARATLNRIAEVRPVNVQVAQAEVDNALAAVGQAQANLKLAYVRSPQGGQILKIHTRPGEIIDNQGIVEMGQTDQMEVIAEVYQTDISKVSLGQKATITSDVFEGEILGKVTRIGSQVSRQNILAVESGSDVDRRIVEVRISLDTEDSQRVKYLTNLQVQVGLN